MPLFEGNVGLAVGISVGAGLSTLFGAVVLFLPRRIREQYFSLILGVSLAVASGVMLYVSFAEIYFKSLDAAALALKHHIDVEVGFDNIKGEAISEPTVFGYTFPPHWTVSLLVNGTMFGGMMLAVSMDWLIHKFAPEVEGSLEEADLQAGGMVVKEDTDDDDRLQGIVLEQRSEPGSGRSACRATVPAEPLPTPPVTPLLMAAEPDPAALEEAGHEMCRTPSSDTDLNRQRSADALNPLGEGQPMSETVEKPVGEVEKATGGNVSRAKLQNLGLLSVLAIGLHNLPEGLATFTACLETPSMGLPLAVGIALHNVPEGICVAVPIYFATGSRRKAIFWTFISGVMEPIGGILGYMALKEVIGDMTYAIIFGLVTGMMIQIVINEYLPVCHKLPIPKLLIVLCVIGGMAVMWLSILILNL
eukprot:EG_transcript_6233